MILLLKKDLLIRKKAFFSSSYMAFLCLLFLTTLFLKT
jgi:hypothetical protein